MTLITSIILGLACGYFLGLRPKALAVFVPVWLAVLIVQTTVVLEAESVPPDDWAYVPAQSVIFVVGMAMIWAGAKLRARLSRA